jgi:hypothetical protein
MKTEKFVESIQTRDRWRHLHLKRMHGKQLRTKQIKCATDQNYLPDV